MSDLYIWHEFVEIGNSTNTLPCKKICFSKRDIIPTIAVEQNKINIITKEILTQTNNDSYLPKCILNSFGQNILNKINMDLTSSIIILTDSDLDLEENKVKILSCHANFCINFCMDKIISELLLSYSVNKTIDYMDNVTKDKILEQIDIDFPRMELYYNNKKCETLYHFKSSIEKFNQYVHNKLYTLYYLIIMLCTQASFYYPFSVIYNIYSLPETDIYILSSDDFPYVNVVDNGTNIVIVFRKIFKYFNIGTERTITKFHTFMVITIDLVEEKNGYIFYGKKYATCSKGMLYWIKENNLIVL